MSLGLRTILVAVRLRRSRGAGSDHPLAVRRTAAGRSPIFEGLEPRRLLSGAYTVEFAYDAGPQRIDYAPVPPPPTTGGVRPPRRAAPLGGVFPDTGETFALTNLTTDTPVDRGLLARSPGPTTGSFRLTAPGLPAGTFADGNYELLLPAEETYAGSGDPARRIEEPHAFFQLAGDMDRDRLVGEQDLGTLEGYLGTMTGATYANGDIDGDGDVDNVDYAAVQAAYGLRLPPPPTAANSVTAAAHPDGTASVQWTAPADGTPFDGFRVYRSTDGTNFARVAEVPDPAARAWADTGLDLPAGRLAQGERYWYRVRPYTDAAGSAHTTNKFWAVTPLPAPTVLRADAVSPTAVTLSWQDGGDGTARFSVQRQDQYGNWLTHVNPASGAGPLTLTSRTSAEIAGLSEATSYTFRIVAHTSDAQSAPTEPVTTLTPLFAAAQVIARPLARDEIIVRWADRTNIESGYIVERSLTESGDWTRIANLPPDTTLYVDNQLPHQQRYNQQPAHYRVVTLASNGTEYTSAVTSSRTLPRPPDRLSVEAVAVSQSAIRLVWAPTQTPQTRVSIERLHVSTKSPSGIPNSVYVEVAEAAASDGEYVDSGLEPRTRYSYRLRVKNAYGASTPNTGAVATTLYHLEPKNLVAQRAGPGINLSWEDAGDAGRFDILIRSNSPSGPSPWTIYAALDGDVHSVHIAPIKEEASSVVKGDSVWDFQVRAVGLLSQMTEPTSYTNIASVYMPKRDGALPSVLVRKMYEREVPEDEDAAEMTSHYIVERLGGDVSEALTVYFSPLKGTAQVGVHVGSMAQSVVIPKGEAKVDIGPIPRMTSDAQVGSVYASFGVLPNSGYNTTWGGWGEFPSGGGLGFSYPTKPYIEIAGLTDGKAIAANSGDADGDGVPDFADGYNLDESTPEDDRNDPAEFKPVYFRIEDRYGSYDANRKITIDYDASDPRQVAAIPGTPYALPDRGSFRLWRKDANEARDPRPVSEGGDYIPPGVYDWESWALGPFQWNWFKLYLEPVRPSAVPGGNTLSIGYTAVRSDGAGTVSLQDSVEYTASQVELLGRGYAEQDFSRRDWLIHSDLTAAPRDDLTAGAFQVHKVRVYDPRTTGIDHITLGEDQVLPLNAVAGGYYETPEFVVVAPGSSVAWSLPYPVLEFDEGAVGFRYNPGGNLRVRRFGVENWPESAKTVVTTQREIIREMKADMSWRSKYNAADDGMFGKELGERTAKQLADDPSNTRWMRDVYVDVKTKKVLHVGDNPPVGVANNPDVQQIDLLHMGENKEKFETNNDWDLTRVDSVHEVKATSKGTFKGNQKRRYVELTKDDLSKLHATNTEELYIPGTGLWVVNKRYQNLVTTLKMAGIGAATYAGAELVRYMDEFDALIAEYEELIQFEKNLAVSYGQNIPTHLRDDLRHRQAAVVQNTSAYISNFTPGDDSATDAASLAAAAILRNLGQSQ